MAHPLAGTWGKSLILGEHSGQMFVGRAVIELFTHRVSDAAGLAMIISPARGLDLSQEDLLKRISNALSASLVSSAFSLKHSLPLPDYLTNYDGKPLIGQERAPFPFLGRMAIELFENDHTDDLVLHCSPAQGTSLSQEQLFARIALALPIRIRNDENPGQNLDTVSNSKLC